MANGSQRYTVCLLDLEEEGSVVDQTGRLSYRGNELLELGDFSSLRSFL